MFYSSKLSLIYHTHTYFFLLSILSPSFCQSNDCSTSLALTLSCPDTNYYFLLQRKMVQAMHNFDLALFKRIRISHQTRPTSFFLYRSCMCFPLGRHFTFVYTYNDDVHLPHPLSLSIQLRTASQRSMIMFL